MGSRQEDPDATRGFGIWTPALEQELYHWERKCKDAAVTVVCALFSLLQEPLLILIGYYSLPLGLVVLTNANNYIFGPIDLASRFNKPR